ncbi:LOW QUALITY PROTEIN: E3 ubiquitin-protein ligase RHA2A-like [Eucalyptus grandis]|uniref:LOW QUALITY PROTEIN: E3 ubiquitin-protein ligase RHA2A-like n=1 Tax=Eucalyptus grandis TaxID=71139 RepID=UPI00192EBFB0|nr:LOW QUALITY PROTEIN: E3 ubiquitin-protein ligase RHA2A-like [Eucalyptus grandis]
MGLQSQLNDVSSDSIPLLLLALAATCVAHLRSSLSCLLHSLGLPAPSTPPTSTSTPPPPPPTATAATTTPASSAPLGSSLAGLIVLAEQLNLNRLLSDRFSVQEGGGVGVGGGTCSECCMVCLCGLGEGDRVRRLPCRHVFHKRCFDGWLDQLKFDCPVCRSKLVPDERVELTARRVGGDVAAFFSPR